MTKKSNINTFMNETYSRPPKKNYPTSKKVYNLIDEIWSFDLADFSDFSNSYNKAYRYILVTIDNFSKYVWAIPPKKKNNQKHKFFQIL